MVLKVVKYTYLCYNNIMNQAYSGNPDRNVEFRQFTLELIDDRQAFERKVKQHATEATISLSGYGRDNLQLPTFVGLPVKPEGIPGIINFEIKKTDGTFAIDSVHIFPEDYAPLVLRDDHGIILRESLVDTTPLPHTALNEVLFSLFPPEIRHELTVDKAVEVIKQLSPESSSLYTFSIDGADFMSHINLSETETIDDSIFSLEVTKTIIHPSGQLIGTRMNLTESIQRQIANADITQNVLMLDVQANSSPISPYTFEDISNEKAIPIPIPKKSHIEDIIDVLDRLDKYGFDSSNSSAA